MFQRDNPELCHQMKRSKQTSGKSPRLGPSPRLRSSSISSTHSSYAGTPETGPMPMLLEPTQMTIGGSSMNSGMNDVQSTSFGSAGQQQASFRSLSSSFQNGTTGLPTGLGVLLAPDGNLVTGKIAPIANTQHHFQQSQQQHQSRFMNNNGQPVAINNGLSTEQLRLMEQDMIDRDRQASSLAAAGMVADQVALHPSSNQISSSTPEPNFDLGLGDYGHGAPLSPTAIEEMDADFSRMFDPSYELQNMETEGSGWPSMNNNDNNN